MLRPMLVVGVGGSGGKTLQMLHRELRWRLRDAEWDHGVPKGWQFIHFDVPTSPDTGLGGEADLVNSTTVGGVYAGLAPHAVDYKAIDTIWLGNAGSPELTKSASWRPVPNDVRISIADGAGQFRTIGRVISLAQAAKIKEAIASAHRNLTDPSVQSELQQLSNALGGEATGTDIQPLVVIVSSMAGGSGAGMFLDIADIIRSFGPSSWFDRSIGVLYTADVFEDLPAAARRGVMPNSLAALCEMMNGYWNNTQPGAEFNSLEKQGVAVGGFTRRGIRYPLLVGKSNGRVTFPTQLSVYEASSKTLAAFMTSPAAQQSITAYLTGNWTAAALGLPDESGFKDGANETVTSAMGMGSLSLGRDRFARYSSQRLARSVAEHALRAHTVGRKVPEEMTFEAARDQEATALFGWFIDQCRLDEIGEERNQVLDALQVDDTASREAIRSAIAQQVRSFPSAKPQEYCQLIINQIEQLRPKFVQETDAELRKTSAVWVGAITDNVINATLEAASRSGLEVAVELLRRLLSHLSEVVTDLRGEITRYQRDATRLNEGVLVAVEPWGGAEMVCDNDLLVKAADNGLRTLQWDLAARTRLIASDLLQDMSRGFLTPFSEAFKGGMHQLRVDENPPPDMPSIGVENWPTGDIIPPSILPALNERLVEEVDTFPAAYHEQLSQTVPKPAGHDGPVAPQQAERIAVGEILTGRTRGVGEDQPVITMLSPWWPQQLNSQSPASIARYEVRLGAADILDRAEKWVHRRDTAIGDFVHKSLRSYIEDEEDPAAKASKVNKLLGAFQAVLQVAPPLVGVSNALAGQIHEGPPTSQYHFTAIPFDGTDLEAEILNLAKNSGLPDDVLGRIEKSFGVGSEQRIEVITTLNQPVQPVILESVMKPIAQQWISDRGSQFNRDSFWRWRRARALTEFVPVSPAVLDWMISGWFVGRLLGQIEWNREQLDTTPVTIWDEAFSVPLPFPSPLFGPSVIKDSDLLPAILESIGAAMVQCHVDGTVDPLKAYRQLRHLGEHRNQLIPKWINFGSTPGNREPIERAWKAEGFEALTREAATPAGRQAAVVAYFEGRRRAYVDNVMANPVTMATITEQPRHLDLVERLADNFDALIAEAKTAVSIIDVDGD